jgi:serine/threonine-protein kinase PknK
LGRDTQRRVKLAGALEAAHRAGTLHRDVKPANILLSDYGEPQLTDFGIARIAGGFQTTSGIVTGSPAFTAPEVLEGKAPTPTSDVYSLGATLFCVLTGHAAFERRSGEQVVAQFLRITSQPIPDLRKQGLPDDASAIIERAMARDPADRPASAAEFGDELREVQRRNNLSVDEMARPIDLSVERRTPARAHTGGRSRTVTAPPTPATKYRPPIPTAGLVTRHRLIDLLRAGERRRLVLIHAPSGFGKSTLAAQWCAELAGEGVAVGWLSIDDDDNNVVWFLAHLLEAIGRVRPALAESLGPVIEEHGEEADRYVLTALVDQIHASGDRVALVIDDWHRVSNAKTIAALRVLLDNGCHHLQIIVTSWSRSWLPLSTMRIHDELIEIDSTALRFDADEAKEFLIDVGGLELSPSDVDALIASADGWAVALQLATLSLRGGEDVASLLDRLSGSEDIIGEFLTENVLDTLEPEMLEFLLLTSITERICGGLASVLAKVTRGQAMLEDVERRGLFLRRIDDDRHWFRYHHMFAEFLRRRLERDRPDQIDELHRTAAEWYAENHHLNDAVDHALAAGDPVLAVDLVERDDTYLLEQAKMTTLLEIVKKLPPQLVVTRPRLQLVIAWANSLLQRPAPTNVALNRYEAALDRSDLSDAERADMRVEANAVRSVMAIVCDRIDNIDDLVAEALSRPDTLHPRVGVAAGNVAAAVAIYRFDFEAARQYLDFAAPYHEMIGPIGGVYTRCWAGLAAKYQLEIPIAMEAFQQAYQMAAKVGPHSHAVRLAGAFFGELLYETGDLSEAARLLDESYALGSEGGGVDSMAARYAAGALIKAAEGDLASAADRLADGMRVAENLRLPRLAARINNERIRLGIAIAPAEATRLLSPRTVHHDNGIATMTAELDEDSAVRLLSASDSPDERAQACQRARNVVEAIDSERRPWAALRAQLLLVETLTVAGQVAEADAAAAPVIARCSELGLWRLLTDAGLK